MVLLYLTCIGDARAEYEKCWTAGVLSLNFGVRLSYNLGPIPAAKEKAQETFEI